NQLNDLHIDRPYVSQLHASIEVTGKQLVVKNPGSTNRTTYRGQKLVRDQPVDETAPHGLPHRPLVISPRTAWAQATDGPALHTASVLDIGTPAGAAHMEKRRPRLSPGQEDPFIRQLVPYIEAYRHAWSNVYRLIYEHLTRLQPEVRTAYIKRLLIEHPAVAQETEIGRA